MALFNNSQRLVISKMGLMRLTIGRYESASADESLRADLEIDQEKTKVEAELDVKHIMNGRDLVNMRITRMIECQLD